VDWFACLLDAIAGKRPVAAVTVVSCPGRPELVGRHLAAGPEGALASELGASELGASELGASEPGAGNSDLVARILERAAEALSSGKAGTVGVMGARVYIEPYLPLPALVVIGAGHVAQPVAHLGKMLGFEVTVIDDRPEYASPARFPDADQVICQEFIAALRSLALGPRHHLVIVTRGHRYDMDCLRETIDLPVAYIGMIGSRNRVQTVFRLLEEEYGIDPAHFARVHSPIGLDLGARTPAEIAVAVVAELLMVRRGGSGEPLSRLGRAQVHGR
jgi:xanthine dehydrogenase accessory factor